MQGSQDDPENHEGNGPTDENYGKLAKKKIRHRKKNIKRNKSAAVRKNKIDEINEINLEDSLSRSNSP